MKNSNTNDKKAKKKYTAPQLIKHGSVSKLTLKGGSTPDFTNTYNP
ncbi:lasso RiPP family leader peptide-containing protein [Lacihabitans soyangensis]|nr:lasso RiPP family leader peptide-containing protein [Lacihabitans soyangensis]